MREAGVAEGLLGWWPPLTWAVICLGSSPNPRTAKLRRIGWKLSWTDGPCQGRAETLRLHMALYGPCTGLFSLPAAGMRSKKNPEPPCNLQLNTQWTPRDLKLACELNTGASRLLSSAWMSVWEASLGKDS